MCFGTRGLRVSFQASHPHDSSASYRATLSGVQNAPDRHRRGPWLKKNIPAGEKRVPSMEELGAVPLPPDKWCEFEKRPPVPLNPTPFLDKSDFP